MKRKEEENDELKEEVKRNKKEKIRLEREMMKNMKEKENIKNTKEIQLEEINEEIENEINDYIYSLNEEADLEKIFQSVREKRRKFL